MESFFVRYRNLVVLLAILLAQIIGLAVQVRRMGDGRNSSDPVDGPGVRLIRLWANALVSPAERGIHGSKIGVGGLWQNYIDLRHVQQQNQDLQKTIDRLRLEQAQLIEDARQGQRLQGLIGFQEKYIYKTLAAQAFGSSGSDQSRVFYIDKGASDGLVRDMAVITADGIVGKVRDVFPHSAQVLAINDQTSGAGVILETTRIRGILRGNAAGMPQIVGILADNRIQPGEKVLTAGGDQIFPRGMPVGVVEKVIRDPERDGFIFIIVKPAAHLDRLDEVLVVTSTEPRFSSEDQQDIATSEALKGPEAAAMHDQQIRDQQILDQQKASEIMAEHLPGLIDPNLPPDQQPLHDTSNPNPVTNPPRAMHPDRFTPGATDNSPATDSASDPQQAPNAAPDKEQPRQPSSTGKPATKPAVKSASPATGKSRPSAARPAAEEPLVMAVLSANFRRDLEIRRYPSLVYALVPLAALVLQAWLPRVLGRFAWFDLPLVVTVYFALGRRSPIQGTLMGASMGLFEDALSHHAIGINGIAKTVAGFLAASVGVRIDVDNFTVRLLFIFVLSILASVIYVFVTRFLLGMELEFTWFTELFKAIGNSVIAIVTFPLLDRLQIRD